MKKTNKTVAKLIIDYLEYCEIEKGLAQKTQENYYRFLNRFTSWLETKNMKDLQPDQIDEKVIWDYRLHLAKFIDPRTRQNLKKRTQNYYLIALRGLLDYFVEKDIKSIPPNKIKLPKLTDKDKQIKFLNFPQIQKLLEMPNINNLSGLRDRAILEVLFSTGLRVSEIAALNTNLFDFKVAAQLLKSNRSFELTISGKGGSVRTVYFSPVALYWLIKYYQTRKDDDRALFINYKNSKDDAEKRLTVRSIARMVNKYAMSAGLPVLATPHTLRHSFATDLLSKGAGLRDVQEFLGHKNIATTQIYTHVTNKQLKEIHEKFHSGSLNQG